jgi:hypothetical protein
MMTPDQRAVLRALIAEAHAATMLTDGSHPSRLVAVKLVDSLRDLDRFGDNWPLNLIDSFAISGASKACSDWRRRNTLLTTTAKGHPVTLPAYAGSRREGTAVQGRLDRMDAAALRAVRKQRAATRDTLSYEIAIYDRALKLMDADPCLTTVGAALEAMEAA